MSELPTLAHTAPHRSGPRGNVSGFPGGSSAVSPLGLHGRGDPRGLAPEGVSLVWLRGGDFKARGLSHGRVGVAAREAKSLFRLNPSETSYSLQSPGLPSTVKALGSQPILTLCKAAVSQLPLRLLWALALRRLTPAALHAALSFLSSRTSSWPPKSSSGTLSG